MDLKPSSFEYVRPGSLAEALEVLAERGDDAKVLAGGQSLVALMNLRLATPSALVDISGLDELRKIDAGVEKTVIGATVRQAEAEDAATVAQWCPLLAAALPQIAHREIRNSGTVCGSAAHADPAAEIPAVALALDAQFVIETPRGVRLESAADFFIGYLTTSLAADEILTHIVLPSAERGAGFAFEELSPRHGDYGIVGVATSVTLDSEGRMARVRIAYSGIDSVPIRVPSIEDGLSGVEPTRDSLRAAATAATAVLEPQSDLNGSSEYRRQVAAVLTARALEKSCSDASRRAETR